MKIRKATISVENVFNKLKINFLDKEGPTIHYFVGNNGAGKTHLLEALYSAIARQKLERAGSVQLKLSVKNDEIIASCNETCNCSLDVSWEPPSTGKWSAGEIKGVKLSKAEQKSLRKAVYSNVEINFTYKDIGTVSAETADNDIPKESATDLNTSIPQLLVNLQQQDANLRSNWMKDNACKQITVPQKVPGQKLDRFTDAYDEVFDGDKKFQKIPEESGNYKINFTDSNDNIVELKDLSSGEKQIIYRLGFILKNLETINGGMIFIDEPEISLHPIWQLKFKELLIKIFRDTNVQIFIATHSPYIFGTMDADMEECIKISRQECPPKKISFPSSRISTTPSMNLVNFLAYDIPSDGLHIELYNELQALSGKSSINGFDNWLERKGLNKENRSKSDKDKYQDNDGKDSKYSSDETLPTWIRNKMHHPDLNDRKEFDPDDLKESIDMMLDLIRKLDT